MQQVIANYQVSPLSPVTVGGTGTSAKYFPQPSGNFTSGAQNTPSASSAVGQLILPPTGALNAQIWKIQAAGNFEVGAGGACPNVTIELVANTGTPASPTYTRLAGSGTITAQSLTGTFYPWFVEATLQGDSASGIVSGFYSMMVDGAFHNTSGTSAVIALDNNLSSINFQPASTASPNYPFGLVIRVTFSVSESGNSANLYQFQVIG